MDLDLFFSTPENFPGKFGELFMRFEKRRRLMKAVSSKTRRWYGAVDLATGTFQQVGPNAPVGSEGLAAGSEGSLLTLGYNSDPYSINPVTGTYTLVGPTGFGDCTTPESPCGPTSNPHAWRANGSIYATDFQNRIYRVNPLSAATLIGALAYRLFPSFPPVLTLMALSTSMKSPCSGQEENCTRCLTLLSSTLRRLPSSVPRLVQRFIRSIP